MRPLLCGIFLLFWASIFSQETGFIPPDDETALELKSSLNQYAQFGLLPYDDDREKDGEVEYNFDFNATRLDLREHGLVTDVKDQNNCGSCWAFSAAASYESSYAMRNKKKINVSEQHALNCCQGSCRGGIPQKVFQWMMDGNKLTNEMQLPYIGNQQFCSDNYGDYGAVAWNYVDEQQRWNVIPSIMDIKKAICAHGALVSTVTITSSFIQYNGGIHRENTQGMRTDHAITIIGWDDSKNAWLIKNSWSEDWGENGFMWLDYKSNNIGINTVWVDAKIDNNVRPDEHIENNTTSITISDALASNQLYEEVTLHINNQIYIFSLDKNSNTTSTENINLPEGRSTYEYHVSATTIVNEGNNLKMTHGSGNETIELVPGRSYMLYIDPQSYNADKSVFRIILREKTN